VKIEQQIMTIIQELPPERQVEVLDFAEFLKQRIVSKTNCRPSGLAKGDFVVPDDFDAPLPEDILEDFES
jgi:hypothetical protein